MEQSARRGSEPRNVSNVASAFQTRGLLTSLVSRAIRPVAYRQSCRAMLWRGYRRRCNDSEPLR